jgi:hypothetical protein
VPESPENGPCEVSLGEGLLLGDAGEVALEDYARVLTASLRAEAVRGGAAGGPVTAVRLVAPRRPPSDDQRRDIEDFARGLATQDAGAGLGWA